MSLLVFILVFTSASLHVTWNALVKTCHDKVAFAWVTTVLGVMVLGPFFTVDLLLGTSPLPGEAILFSVISGIFEALYIIFLFKAYEYSDLSVVYPLSRGIAPIVSMVLAGSMVGDVISMKGMLVVGLIFSGVTAVSLSSLNSNKYNKLNRLGILMAFCTGCMIAGYHLVDRKAMLTTPRPSAIGYLFFVQFFMAVFVSLWAVFLARKTLGSVWIECKENLKGVLIVGIVTPVAYLLIILALTMGNVTYIVAGRNIGIVLSTLVGALFLGEKVKGLRLLGALLIAVGVILLIVVTPGA